MEFALPEGSEEIVLQDNALALTPGKPFVCQMLGAHIRCVPDLATKAADGKRHGLALAVAEGIFVGSCCCISATGTYEEDAGQ